MRGAVAQLGERGLCKPEVVGSIPISSTSRASRGLRRGAQRAWLRASDSGGRLGGTKPVFEQVFIPVPFRGTRPITGRDRDGL